MSILSERIDLLCTRKGITGYRLCKDIGVSPNLLTELRGGRRNGISAKTADKIANYFGVSVGYLLGTEETEKPVPRTGDELSKEELDYIKWFREKATEREKELIRLIVQGEEQE